MKYQLRDYQQQSSDAAVSFFQTKNDRNGLLVLPTGAGKSLVIADIAFRLGEPLLVLQPSREILAQNFAKLKSYGVEDCSIYSASLNSKEISRITFATIGSIMAHIDDFDHFKYIMVDECFDYHHFVSTERGQIRIGTLYNMYKNGVELPKVLSFNESTQRFEAKPIVRVMCNRNRMTNQYLFNSSFRLTCTPSHPVLTLSGWKAIDELNIGEAVLCVGDGRSFRKMLNEDQEQFILGSIIGDANVNRRPDKSVYRFRFLHGEKQKSYLEWKALLMGCSNKVSLIENNGFSHKKAYKFFTETIAFEDYKCSKEYAINNLTPKSLAVLYMDDGHMAHSENEGTICAVAESKSLTELLAKKLNELGIDCVYATAKSSSTCRTYHYIRLHKNGVYALAELCADYIHPSMQYKIPACFRNRCGCYKWNYEYPQLKCLVFQGKRENCAIDVFNLEVEDNHNYVITSSRYHKEIKTFVGGIIVHNCHVVNAQSGQYKQFFDKVKRKILGLTATPYRLTTALQYLDREGKQHFRPKDDEGSQKFDERIASRELTMETRCVLKFLTRTRPRVFHDVVYQVDISTLLSRGYLADVDYFDLSVVDQSKLRRNSTGMDFDDKSLFNEFKQTNFGDYLLSIVQRLLHPKDGKPRRGILVFTKYLEECDALVKRLPSCSLVSGSTPKKERDEILENFKLGCIDVLVNVNCLTTGFDYPELDTVVMARPTMSLALYYQIIGRGIRPHPSKKSLWFVDLCGNIKRFGKVEDLHLAEPNPGEYIITGCAEGATKQLTQVYF